MPDSPSFELPKEWEKLPHKFILDTLREREAQVDVAAPIPSPSPEEAPEIPEPAPSTYEPPCLPPGKKYFRMGDVVESVGVEPYVLRYWESEFPQVKPVKSRSGHRVYRKQDVETLHLIRHLLHVERFSIKGAKKKLAERREEARRQAPQARKNLEVLKGIANELRELITAIRNAPGTL